MKNNIKQSVIFLMTNICYSENHTIKSRIQKTKLLKNDL